MTGGEALASVLKAEGTKYLFSLVVAGWNPLLAACIDEGIEIINVRHEQAAAYAADAWGRITRKPGVSIALGGPGTTNMATALVGAYYECSPLIALAPIGITGTSVISGGESRQFNASRMFEPYVKWSARCMNVSELAKYARWAYRHATSGRMGPVILEMPSDLLSQEVDQPEPAEPEKYRVTARPRIEDELARKAVRMLMESEKPLIVVGGGVHWSDAWPELRDFAQLVKVPVVSKAGLPQGYFPEDNDLYAGVCISLGRPCLSATVASDADLVMTIGSRYEVVTFPAISPKAKLIQIDIEPSEIGRYRFVDLGIVGDAKMVLQQLYQAAKDIGAVSEKSKWLIFVREQRQMYEESLNEAGFSDAKPIKGARLVREIRDFLDEDAYVIIDAADIGSMGRTYLRTKLPGHLMIAPANYGNMGCGIPFALATKLAKHDKQVLLVTSDGSFGFNAMEMETASKYGINIVCVISNNRCWGAEMGPSIRTVGENYTRKIGSWLPDKTRYDLLAQALGCHGELVVDPEDIRSALKRAFDSESPSVLDVRVDQLDMWPTRTSRYKPLPKYLAKQID